MEVKLYQPAPKAQINSFDSNDMKLKLQEISENTIQQPTSIFDNAMEIQRHFNKNPPKYLKKDDIGVKF